MQTEAKSGALLAREPGRLFRRPGPFGSDRFWSGRVGIVASARHPFESDRDAWSRLSALGVDDHGSPSSAPNRRPSIPSIPRKKNNSRERRRSAKGAKPLEHASQPSFAQNGRRQTRRYLAAQPGCDPSAWFEFQQKPPQNAVCEMRLQLLSN
jgi:hypothetical protein